jgi:hypothetical protein
MTLGLKEDMLSTLRRHLTHRVFAKAMASVRISGTEGAYCLFARTFFIHTDKES